ncbi:triose-phosphate isomerase [Candidatus Woesearchaeota archaeon]|nr:triose-phosphate isomerase [Candidatus Woesearchaeota archaeon]
MVIIIVNFKTYQKASGEEAVKLARICEKVAKDTKADIMVAVQNVDLFHVSKEVSIPVLAEHADPVSYGAHTGKDLPESLVDNGATGVIVNHSEDKEELVDIETVIKRAKGIGLQTIVCAPSPESSEAIAAFSPDFIAVEPPELIGGDISVSKAKPDLISNTIRLVNKVDKQIPVLCGAGVKDSEDVRIALELGCKGILVASGITKAKDPEKALRELVSGGV